MILSLSTELHDRLYQALLHCEEFNVSMRLEGDLAGYNSRVFDYPYNAKDEKGKKEELAERAIRYSNTNW